MAYIQRRIRPLTAAFVLFLTLTMGIAAEAQEAPESEAPLSPVEKVEINPRSRDDQIRARLAEIIEATGWFSSPAVRVQDGVVFLDGATETEELKKWAGNLARNTESVAAVVNRIGVRDPELLDIEPALAGLRELWRGAVRKFPIFVFCVAVLALAVALARLAAPGVRRSLRRSLPSPLLRNVAAQAAGLGVILVGIYISLEIAGLTSMALTIVGGTGLLGIIFGIAFRDITENFLASVFLSIQSPFRTGDLVEITGITGFVEKLTTRATVLLTLDGNRLQIPNATVYKSNVLNFSADPFRREDFTVGIGYENRIARAQEVALKALADHPAVLKEPEPWVLADSLGPATVNLRVYFWLDGQVHSWLKVRSSVIRLVKRAFQTEGISMPDEAREIIFPRGVPVHMVGGQAGAAAAEAPPETPSPREPATIATKAEAGLHTEAEDIRMQEDSRQQPGEGENLLGPSQLSRQPQANRQHL